MDVFNRKTHKCCKGQFIMPKNVTCDRLPCGAETYDPISQVCCENSSAFNKTYGLFTQCCGNCVIDTRNKKCCQHSQVRIPSSYSCSPCNKEYYDPTKRICCAASVLHSKTYGQDTECCNSNIYNNRIHKCCNLSIIDKGTHKCCPDNTIVAINNSCPSLNLPLCGAKAYNPQTSICCDGMAIHKKKYHQYTMCCGVSTVYDSRQNHCCRPRNIVLPRGVPCLVIAECAGIPYGPVHYTCCGNKNLHRKTHGDETRCCGTERIYNRKTDKCCKPMNIVVSNTQSCRRCDNTLYDPNLMVCCGGSVLFRRSHGNHTTCCGQNTVIDNRHYTCCRRGNVVIPVRHSCVPCGNAYYDPKFEICCNGTNLHPNRHGPFTKCCGAQKIYDNRDNHCCSSKTVVPHSFSCPSCNGQLYDPATSLCCGGYALHPRLHGHNTMCCGANTIIDRLHNSCCRPVNVSVPNGFSCAPCGQTYYDPGKSICCHGNMLHSKSYGHFTECCGSNKIYDKRASHCCQNNAVIPKGNSCSPPLTCNAHDQVYNPSSHICCNGQQLHRRKYNQHTQCCGKAAVYDNRNSTCCAVNNTVVPKRFSCVPCGNKYYDPLRQFCCEDKTLLPRRYGAYSRCCGNIVFDMTLYRCCRPRNVILPKTFGCRPCRGQYYNPISYICCGDKILHHRPNVYFECCGESLTYDRRHYNCCHENAPRLANGTCPIQVSLQPRCNGLPYDHSTHICCNNNSVHRQIYHQFTTCCGTNKTFDSRSHKCCPVSQTSLPKSHSCTPCDRTYYDPIKYICCGKKKLYHRGHGIYTKCCGENLVYDMRQYRCCSSLRVVPKNTTCPLLPQCNGKLYNPAAYICCGNSTLYLRKYGQETKCCGGDRMYDSTKQKCCSPANVVVPVSIACIICSRKTYNPNIFICCSNSYLYLRRYGSYTGCCGAKSLYDIRMHKCCQDRTIVPASHSCQSTPLCNGKPYDSFKSICCGGTHLHDRKHEHFTQCCGALQVYHSLRKKCCAPTNKVVLHSYSCLACDGKFYNPSKAICCNGKAVHTKNYGLHTKCCGTAIYDERQTRCCSPSNRIVSNTFSCITCGGKYYDSSKSICCGGTSLLSRVNGNNTYCCGAAKVYDRRTQQCCYGDTIVGISVQCQPKLCSGKPYDSSKLICCDGRVLLDKKYGSFTACCGTKKVYHKATHKCCNGSAVVPPHYSCDRCDKRYYDPARLICCDHINLYYRKFGKHSTCCGRAIYDSRTRKCCDSSGATVPKGSLCSPVTCGGKPFDGNNFICCNNTAILERKYGQLTGCCHSHGFYNVYHVQSQRCCFERPIPVLQPCKGQDDCGSNLDITKYVCCAGRKVFKAYGFLSRCCGVSAYHPLIQICCAGTPAPRSGGSAVKCCGQRSFNTKVAKCCPGNHIVAKCESCS